MVTGHMPTEDERIETLEVQVLGDEAADIPSLETFRGQVHGVLGNHEKRLRDLEPPKAQPRDWFLVADKETAAQWLDELDQWYGRVLNHIKPGLIDEPCWRWHPAVIAKLLVLQGLWMTAKRPDQAAVLWDRYLSSLAGKVAEELKNCRQAGKHRGHDCGHTAKQSDGTVISDWIVDEPTDDAGRDMLRDDYLTWWCGSREGIPPGLMPA